MKKIMVKLIVWMLAPLLKKLATGQESFIELDKHGIHLMQSSFYSPIPDLCKLKPSVFERSIEMPGVDMNEGKQLELLQSFSLKYRQEYSAFPLSTKSEERTYCADNDSFPAQDGALLHCMVRHFKPKRIIEINGLTRLIEKQVQDVPFSEFEKLGENDILFIDSSHVLKIDSDVHYEYLEIFPRLKPGVLIHIHDIFLPMEYPKQWLEDRHWFWNEQYLLQAFLSFNDKFEVLYSGPFMAKKYSDEMKSFSQYTENNLAASFWMRRI